MSQPGKKDQLAAKLLLMSSGKTRAWLVGEREKRENKANTQEEEEGCKWH